MRAAVTGGSGFIGSHVIDSLADAGHDVVVLDVRGAHRSDVDSLAVDILDLDALVSATNGCDAVFHLAAVSNVNDAFDDPVGAVQLNIVGTANVWEAARRNGVGRAILASTVWVYAGAVGDAVDEDSPFFLATAGHVYTSSKIAGEMLVHNYFDLYGQPFTILRYGIPFGPRMRDELVIPRFVQAALRGETIRIDGDGNQYRNYVYIEDLARAHVLALGEAAENEVINLEGAEPVSIRRIAETVIDIVDSSTEVEYVHARQGDFAGRTVSADKARELLGWEPSVSFEDGMRRYVEWRTSEAEKVAER
ncbi:MAG: NAD-dependent epimerase/dehydratase family protein [Actinobacteria bacterium]|nr:NAD-dependent epimerase/dehydratase family protein [Actinomycetota bacterium]